MIKKDEDFFNDLHSYFKGLEFEKKYIKITVYVDIMIHNQKYIQIGQNSITRMLREWCRDNDIFYTDSKNKKYVRSFKLFKK